MLLSNTISMMYGENEILTYTNVRFPGAATKGRAKQKKGEVYEIANDQYIILSST